MDIAIALDRLLPAAQYSGSLTDNNEAAYNAITWLDQREKPLWASIEDEYESFEVEQSALKDYRVYDYVPNFFGDKKKPPLDIDFLTGLTQRLHPKHTFNFGELNQTIYYVNATPNQSGGLDYSTPVVKETFVYTRHPVTGFPLYRVNTLEWYFADDTISPINKILTKYYIDDPISQLAELSRRRDNNIKNTIGAIIKLALATSPGLDPLVVLDQGRQFFYNSALNRSLYIEDGNPALLDDVRNEATIEWFNNDVQSLTGLATIRSYIIYQLSLGTETE